MVPAVGSTPTFAELGLSNAVVRGLEALGYVAPTRVQLAAIPAILRGGDVWGSGETGSGKTAAFALPLLETLSAPRTKSPRPTRALILVPTRELATQVADAFRDYGRFVVDGPKVCFAIGGVSINPQMMALRGGADVVVATPGRLLDLVEQNALRLSSVETLVLDEADRLLSLGFAGELARVLSLLPERRQNLLFSATFPSAVAALAERLLHEPTRIDLNVDATPVAAIVQRFIAVDTDKRTLLLRHLLRDFPQALVFAASQHTVVHLTAKLERAGIDARPFHGDQSQGARTEALAGFKAKKVRVLVATDLAARGIDIAELPLVVNYDLPRSTVDYLHRIGRTGRAGESGLAVSFVTAATDAHFRLIAKRYALNVELERIAGFEPTELAPSAEASHGGVKGKRKSKKDKLREALARAKTEKS
ncbi:MAG TPA: DEAD/DEAH box helicase [Polyangiaceae bacterium]|jgi:superfamily II DNA/RNA helicase|nr:DEAD/DEAH box helicase [Polyangiaceae bacterium]